MTGRAVDVLMYGNFIDPLEEHGVQLVNTMLARTRASQDAPTGDQSLPEGPHFVYEHAPNLFGGRSGRGPLHVAWDTNLLIDYFERGPRLWSGESMPDTLPGTYGEELEGLQLIVTLWVLRDIRFHVPRFFLRDTKRKALSSERRRQRHHAMHEFLQAIALVADGGGSDGPKQWTWHRTDQVFLNRVPAGNDRALVEEALRSGMDVFLTRDAGVLAAKSSLRLLGLTVASPLDLVEELAAAGALHCLFEPRSLYWAMPDQARVAHLVRAMGPSVDP
ncbi:hypothetical protein ACOCJ7_09635 [Knoellia sp. CPCC 206453]|uniref:hypothetical protein n=1 Tax=Knoellia pratensis TaxID=3404796 RepID=UPI00361222A5